MVSLLVYDDLNIIWSSRRREKNVSIFTTISTYSSLKANFRQTSKHTHSIKCELSD